MASSHYLFEYMQMHSVWEILEPSQNPAEQAGDAAQWHKYLPGKCQVLSWISSTNKTNQHLTSNGKVMCLCAQACGQTCLLPPPVLCPEPAMTMAKSLSGAGLGTACACNLFSECIVGLLWYLSFGVMPCLVQCLAQCLEA